MYSFFLHQFLFFIICHIAVYGMCNLTNTPSLSWICEQLIVMSLLDVVKAAGTWCTLLIQYCIIWMCSLYLEAGNPLMFSSAAGLL